MRMPEILCIVREVEATYAEHKDDHKSLELFVSLIEKEVIENCIKALEDDGRMMAAELLRTKEKNNDIA